jgi:tetratricopeptide (TPR) repeat protein
MRWLGLLLCAALWTGCAGHAAHTLEARRALDRHDPKEALELINEELDVSSGGELPSDDDDDVALFLLDRSMISQQLGAHENSSKDLETADKQIEMLDFSRSTADEIGRYLFSDDVGEYKARPFEKLFINTMNMVNYLAEGNLAGAKVEARRFAVMQKYLRESQDDKATALLGPGSYLAGFVFEQAGQADEALRFYDEALAAQNYLSLHEPVRRLAQRSGYRSPRINKLLEAGGTAPEAEGGELLVIVGYGRVPALHAERIPIGLALTIGAVHMSDMQVQSARRAAGQGLVTWVNFPSLDKSPACVPASVKVGSALLPLDGTTRIDDQMRAAYEATKGQVIASAIVRMVTRGAVGAGVGTGVGKASNSGAVGMLAALVTQAALAGADTPDTRSWATLPARIGFVRMRLPAGKHQVQITAQGRSVTRSVEVRSTGYTAISFTELSQ